MEKIFLQAIKPAVKFVTKKHRTNTVTPSSCNYDIVESEENRINESDFLHFVYFRFHDEITENKANELSETIENQKNEELEKRLLQTKTNFKNCSADETVGHKMVRASSKSYFTTPACLVESETKKLEWASLPEAEICKQEGVCASKCQKANKRTLVSVA